MPTIDSNRTLSPLVNRRLAAMQSTALGNCTDTRVTGQGYPSAYLDRKVRPQDDFYQFATGGYQSSHPLPGDKSEWGTYSGLREKVTHDLTGIMEASAAVSGAPAGSADQLVGDLYASAMNTAQCDAAGATPLKPWLDEVGKLRSNADIPDLIGRFHAAGLASVFSYGAEGAGQAGLALPSVEYYTDPKHQADRDAYVTYMQTVFGLMGEAPQQASADAAAVMRVEMRLAKGAKAPSQLRDPKETFHPMDHDGLSELTPAFDWNHYFQTIGRPDIEYVNVTNPDFFTNMNSMLGDVPLDDWKAYLRLHTVSQNASFLSKDYSDALFRFSQVLSGTPEQPERSKRMTALTESALGDAVGQKYVAQYFPPEAKAMALEMIDNVKAALRARIEKGWMSPKTRDAAMQKIDQMKVKVGYPDHWESYDGLKIDRGPLIDNVLRIKAWQARKDFDKIGQPIDRDAWCTNASTVNAFYNPSDNSITFPAARLQPPFFDPKQDLALNYGSTGITMGHEMTHGFDDEGSQFDASGHMREWYEPQDRKEFQRRADGVEHQFDGYNYQDTKVSGKLVEGESIADLGGLEVGYDAFKRALAAKGMPDTPGPDGFTPTQRFFLGYALVREEVHRPQDAKLQVETDPHPLGQFRVDGPCSNFEPFFQAFNVAPTDPMHRPSNQLNHIWD